MIVITIVIAIVVMVVIVIMVMAAVVVVVVVVVVMVAVPIPIMLMLVLSATHFVLMLLVALTLFLAMLIAPPIPFMRVVSRRVYLLVPAIRHEIDRSAARIVFVAVLRPMPLVPGWNVQVHRGRRCGTNNDGRRHSDHGSGQNQLRRGWHRDFTANSELAVYARRAKVHRNTDIARERRCLHRECSSGACDGANEPMGESGLHTASAVC
jgi:hypothetical protein